MVTIHIEKRAQEFEDGWGKHWWVELPQTSAKYCGNCKKYSLEAAIRLAYCYKELKKTLEKTRTDFIPFLDAVRESDRIVCYSHTKSTTLEPIMILVPENLEIAGFHCVRCHLVSIGR